MYRYILFDLDGTLTDPKIGICTCVQYALEKMGISEPDIDKLEPFIGPPLGDSFKEFYDMNEEDSQKAIAYYRERFSTVGKFENEVYPGIPELLRDLKKKGKIISIASSKPTQFVEDILNHFEIRDYFDYVVGSELDGSRSKKEEVVEYALHQMFGENEIEYDEVVMIGDRKFDIEGAHLMGIGNIGVSYGYGSVEELEEAGADRIVNTVQGLRTTLLPVFNQGQGNTFNKNDQNGQGVSGPSSSDKDWKSESKNIGRKSFANMWSFFGPALTYWIGGTAFQWILYLILNGMFESNTDFMAWGEANKVSIGHVLMTLPYALTALVLYFQFGKKHRNSETNENVEEYGRNTVCEWVIYASSIVFIGLGFLGLVHFLGIWESSDEYLAFMESKYSIPIWLGIIIYGLLLPFAQHYTFVKLVYSNARKFMRGNMPLLLTVLLFAYVSKNSGDGLYAAVVLGTAVLAYEKTKNYMVSCVGYIISFVLVWLVESISPIKNIVTNRTVFGLFIVIGFGMLIAKAMIDKKKASE